jgi:uncharacterized membrane protein YphA (DoxX/SURF4 family)
MSTILSGGSGASEPRPLILALARFYPAAADLAWALVRVTAGLMLIPHGWPKVGAGPTAIGTRVSQGMEPVIFWGALIILLETIAAC